jgi:hypothetical protein
VRALRISPRRFDGWEPRSHTTISYDAEGRVSELVTTAEPEWDDEDRAILYALEDYEAGLCPGCGHALSESLHREGTPDRTYQAAYAVCLGCAAKERAQRVADDRDQHLQAPMRAARHWTVIERR